MQHKLRQRESHFLSGEACAALPFVFLEKATAFSGFLSGAPKACCLWINSATMQNTGAWSWLGEDCIWRSKTAKGSWNTVETPTLVSKKDEISAMRLGLSMEPDEKMHVEILMKEPTSCGRFQMSLSFAVRVGISTPNLWSFTRRGFRACH